MLRRVDTAIQPWYTIMLIGVWILFIAFVWGVIAISRQLLEDRREKKLLILGDPYKDVVVLEV